MSIATWEFESPPLHHSKLSPFFYHAEIAQLVEHNLAKVGVAGPSPVFRSSRCLMLNVRCLIVKHGIEH